MKSLLVAIIWCTAFACMENSALAIKAVGEMNAEQAQNMVITGQYGGYKSGVIFVVPGDGVRTPYPLNIGKEKMKRLGKLHLNVRVRLTINHGKVTQVEEVSR
jgi:hypothetical protein